MPITFEEISGEVVPERATEPSTAPPAESPAQHQDPAELLRRELQIHRERERRLIAD
jgi:hypothetical protein